MRFNSESCAENLPQFRQLLCQWPFHSESVFLLQLWWFLTYASHLHRDAFLESVNSEVPQTGVGVKFLFWSGEFRRIAHISQRILHAIFWPCFSKIQTTQKIHTQNSCPTFSAFLSNLRFLKLKHFSRRFSAYGGEQKV